MQLKTIQEIITPTVFAFFSWFYLRQPIRLNHMGAFALIVLASMLMFKK